MNNPTPSLRITSKKLEVALYLFIFIFAFIADRLTKIWALRNLVSKNITLFQGLDLSLVWNRGVSWGLFSFKSAFKFNLLLLVILFVILFFCFHTYKMFKDGFNVFFETLIFAGAISNLYDRIFYKGVIDFIDFYIGNYHWPIFNLADVFVVIGVCGLFWRYVFYAYFTKSKRS